MKHLVFLDWRAGELEKILSGIKTMIIKDLAPDLPSAQPVSPGDRLYFLRDNGECDLRVTATVVRLMTVTRAQGEDLAQILKELQPRLQLTEVQYNTWSIKQQVLLVEFDSAQKIGVIRIAAEKLSSWSGWIPFEAFELIAD